MTQSQILDIEEIKERLKNIPKLDLDWSGKSQIKTKDWCPDGFGPVYGPGSNGYDWNYRRDTDYDKIKRENRNQAINKLLDDEDTNDTDNIQSNEDDKE